VSKKYVSKELAKEIHAKAEPFVKWLKEAEEESGGSEEEEDDDEDNVEVKISHIITQTLLQNACWLLNLTLLDSTEFAQISLFPRWCIPLLPVS